MVTQGVVDAPELHKSTAKMLKRVIIDKEHLHVEHNSCRVAVIMPYHEYVQMRLDHAAELYNDLLESLEQEKRNAGDELQAKKCWNAFQMSLRENIQIFHPLDIERYLGILKTEYGTTEHPRQDGAYLIDGLPFYAPQEAEDHVFVLGFNMVPLSYLIIQALADHPELISENVLVRWSQEQDLIFEGQPANCIGS